MISRPKPIIPCAPLFFLFILFTLMASFKLSSSLKDNNISHTILCPETEKQALLNFKQSLEDPLGQLSSWNNRSEVNCCKWKGVVCDNFTGHVQQLRLQSSAFLSGKISDSLLNLTQLRDLDLSNNNFTGTIPSFIGSLRSLQYLNLSNVGFHGAIPHSIGNLSNLLTLALGTEEDTNNLYTDSLDWLSGLSKLKNLSMNRVNLSEAAADWAQVINSLPSLEQVHLKDCNLSFINDHLLNEVNLSSSLAVLDLSRNHGIFLSPISSIWIFQLSNLVYLNLSGNSFKGPIPSISNTTKLQHIDLSYNYFNSTVPDWLYSCRDLHSVDLKYNSLQGSISSAMENLSSLNTLDLTGNGLSGKIPREIGNLCKMQKLILNSNKLQGELSDSFGNMSDCFLDSLQYLDLYGNQLSGHITDQLGEFKSLTYLDLGKNLLSGAIPSSLGQLMSLKRLHLIDNQLSGNLPESLGKLFNLKYLLIRGNKLEGVVTERHFATLKKLIYLDASDYNNQLTLKVNPNWIPPFQLKLLGLGGWDLGTKNIPSWIKTQKNLQTLFLSNTGISGVVPNWIWGISVLRLSDNHLHGKIPDKFGNNTVVNFSSNQFSGSLPRVGDLMVALNLSNNALSGSLSHFLCDEVVPNNLEILLLSGNQLTGELPDCFMNWPSLKVLSLGNNNLSGSIPDSIRFLTNLQSLDLQSNSFSGRIPFSMHKFLGLVNINLAHNNIEGNIPKWMGMSLPDLKFLNLRSNKLSGQISSNICLLNSLQLLDLSHNTFSGMIPGCVDNFTAMANKKSESEVSSAYYFDGTYTWAFTESAVATTKGRESQYSTILGLVTNMDLSNNNLSGDIPKKLASLVELRSLNLSGNHLMGLIPHNIGDMKQLESLDLSRNSLSGGIPDSLATITSLGHLNLSNNNLTGKIPQGPQFSGFEPPSFMGNFLCGPQVKVNCDDGDEVPEPANNGNNQGNKSEIDWFYVFLCSGFATGFSVVCSTLILNKSWRDAYFGFVEGMWDKLYVIFYLKWRMWV